MSVRPRRTVVITGAAGFLGSAIADELRPAGHRVISLDRRGSSASEVDVRDQASLRAAMTAADVVVHAAAVAGVASVREHLVDATSVNVLGTVTALAAAREAGVERFVDLSSEEVYGQSSAPPTEDGPRCPESAYGVHKLAGELLAREFPEIGYVAARLAWVYGRGFPRTRPPQPWLDDAVRGRTSPPGQGADHLADLVHVDDAARAVVSLVEAGHLAHDAYNVGSGRGISLGAVAALIRELRPSWDVELAPGALPGVAQRPPLDTSRIREELGWRPDLSLEEGLRRTLHGR